MRLDASEVDGFGSDKAAAAGVMFTEDRNQAAMRLRETGVFGRGKPKVVNG
jgi:hypothetical protein